MPRAQLVARLVGASSMHQKVVGLIPGQGTYRWGALQAGQQIHPSLSRQCFKNSLCVPLSLSKNQ